MALTSKKPFLTMRHSVEILQRKLAVGIGSNFNDILSETDVARAIAARGVKYRKRLFTPMVTIWAFLYQVLDADKSLRNTVKQLGC